MISQREIIFNNISSTLFNIIPVSINNDEEDEVSVISLEVINEPETRSGEPIDYGVRPNEVISFNITFCHSADNYYITDSEAREIINWLQPDGEFHWMTGTPWEFEQNDEELFFLCRITNIQKRKLNGKILALQATVTCNTWYAYSKEIVKKISVNGEETISITNDSDDRVNNLLPTLSFTQDLTSGLTPSYVYNDDIFEDTSVNTVTTSKSEYQGVIDDFYDMLYITIPTQTVYGWNLSFKNLRYGDCAATSLASMQTGIKLVEYKEQLENLIKAVDEDYKAKYSSTNTPYYTAYSNTSETEGSETVYIYNVGKYIDQMKSELDYFANYALLIGTKHQVAMKEGFHLKMEKLRKRIINYGASFYSWITNKMQQDELYSEAFQSFLTTKLFNVETTGRTYYMYNEDSDYHDSFTQISIESDDGLKVIDITSPSSQEASDSEIVGKFLQVPDGSYNLKLISDTVDFTRLTNAEIESLLKSIHIATSKSNINQSSISIILNSNENNPLEIKNIKPGETIIVDNKNQIIYSSLYVQNSYRTIGDDFNRVWLSFPHGKNELKITGYGVIEIKYRLARKIGGWL